MSEKNIIIRPETKDDYKAVENLTRESFWNVYRPGCMEHYVLHRYRDDPASVSYTHLPPCHRTVPQVHHDHHKLSAKARRLAGILKKGHCKASLRFLMVSQPEPVSYTHLLRMRQIYQNGTNANSAPAADSTHER